jgi:hypothetical protein
MQCYVTDWNIKKSISGISLVVTINLLWELRMISFWTFLPIQFSIKISTSEKRDEYFLLKEKPKSKLILTSLNLQSNSKCFFAFKHIFWIYIDVKRKKIFDAGKLS